MNTSLSNSEGIVSIDYYHVKEVRLIAEYMHFNTTSYVVWLMLRVGCV